MTSVTCVVSVSAYQVAQDIEELNRLCQLTTRPYVRQLLQQELEKLAQKCISPTKLDDSGPEKMSVDTESESSCTNAIAAATEPSTQHSDVTKADSAMISNPCIAVTRSAPQRYYKEITTYGEAVFN